MIGRVEDDRGNQGQLMREERGDVVDEEEDGREVKEDSRFMSGCGEAGRGGSGVAAASVAYISIYISNIPMESTVRTFHPQNRKTRSKPVNPPGQATGSGKLSRE